MPGLLPLVPHLGPSRGEHGDQPAARHHPIHLGRKSGSPPAQPRRSGRRERHRRLLVHRLHFAPKQRHRVILRQGAV